MAADSVHPLYTDFLSDWTQLRDVYRGERRVKEKRELYLPPTQSMIDAGEVRRGSEGWFAYEAYLRRAVFHDVFRQAVEGAIGVMHRSGPTIELPPQLEPLRERATVRHESLAMLLRRINEEQLVTGRGGLLVELPNTDGAGLPFLAFYHAEDIRNWDEGERDLNVEESLNLVQLDETEFERTSGLEWEIVTKYRVLALGEIDPNEPTGSGATYSAGVYRQDRGGFDVSEAGQTVPMLAGRTLERIPFVFVNSRDVVPEPDNAPMLGLSNLALAIYRGEADYRQALFMQGQDTLVTLGFPDDDKRWRIGAGAAINLPAEGDAKFIGVTGTGLDEQRMALENDKRDARQTAGQILDETSRQESGEALKVRVAARTASLTQVAITGAFALQEALRIAAEWVGADPEAVVVTPNLDFSGTPQSTEQGAMLLEARKERQITQRTYLEELRRRNLLASEVDIDEVLEETRTMGASMPGQPFIEAQEFATLNQALANRALSPQTWFEEMQRRGVFAPEARWDDERDRLEERAVAAARRMGMLPRTDEGGEEV